MDRLAIADPGAPVVVRLHGSRLTVPLHAQIRT